MEDNTSYFIAVDFDKENWEETILRLYRTCEKFGVHAYIERSRSGNGGHLWIFFEDAFPAEQSRKIMFEMLRHSGIISQFEKEPSFDRLFPNQDYHSGKGLGNLIALPLNRKSIEHGNTCFLNPDTFIPFENQWTFIESVEKVPTAKLIAFLREQLNFYSSEYVARKNLGKSTFNIEKFFKLIEESDDVIMVPRGFSSSLVQFCKKEGIPFKIVDKRSKRPSVDFDSEIELQPHQEIALEIIAEKRQPALIIVHRKQLFDQWIQRIQDFLKIPKNKIGQIGNQKLSIGKSVTVAMIQSLTRMQDFNELANAFGTIIIDECHHIPAKSFRETVVHFNAFYLYGLTATPKRKNNDQKLIFVYIGNILHHVCQQEYLFKKNIRTEINIKETDLFAPFGYKIDKFETISRILIHDTNRNSLIIKDIEDNANRFKTILILTERKAHVDILNLYLKDRYETITIPGDDPESARKSKMEQIKQGHFKIVISTGQYFGEVIDISNLDCLFIVYPFAFEGKLIQYIGRIQRSEKQPVIFDYRDSRIDHFEKMFKQRMRYYKKLQKTYAS